MNILQYEQSIFDLEQKQFELINSLTSSFTIYFNTLLSDIQKWEFDYLIIAPCSGKISFTKYWQQNQNIKIGDVLVTVVPENKKQIIGRILLPPQGAGKVKIGQIVNVKFDNYPFMEYGIIKVKIQNISLIPVEIDSKNKSYILEVVFPDSLITTYGKKIEFNHEMTGSVEIITDDLRLINKFINPIMNVLKK